LDKTTKIGERNSRKEIGKIGSSGGHGRSECRGQILLLMGGLFNSRSRPLPNP
jgi:hypothetical protein